MENLATEAESAATDHRMGQIYQVTKKLSGKKSQKICQLKTKTIKIYVPTKRVEVA